MLNPDIQTISTTDLSSFSFSAPDGIAVIMPCTDTEMGLKTAEILHRRAGMDCNVFVVYDNNRQGFIKTLNDSAARISAKYIVYLAQDAYPGRGWLKCAYDTLEKTGKSLLAFNDGKWQGRIASFGMVRTSWTKTLYNGPILYPGYKSHAADNELTVIARCQEMHEYNPECTLLEYDPEKDFGGSNREDKALFDKRFVKCFDGLVSFNKRKHFENLAKEYKVKLPPFRPQGSSHSRGISIIILTRNGAHHLEKLLSTFLAVNTHPPFELIIVDHASTDSTTQTIAKYCDKIFVRLIKRKKNYTFSESCNFGANKARYPYLLFLNNDIIFTDDVLPAALTKLEQNQTIGAVGVRLDDDPASLPEGKSPGVQHTGIHFLWNDKRGYYQPEQIRYGSLKEYLSSQDAFLQQDNSPLGGISKQKEIGEETCRLECSNSSFFPAITGAFLLCRKTDFKSLAGFSEVYNYGLEDIDFCLRLQRELKKKCFCINNMRLCHVEKATRKLGDKKKRSETIQGNHKIFKERWDGYIRSLIKGEETESQALLDGNSKNISLPKNCSEKVSLEKKAKFVSVKGHVDSCKQNMIFGWAADLENDDKQFDIVLYIDGKRVTSCKANIFREDLQRKGIGHGYYGFEAEIPVEWCDGNEHLVQIGLGDNTPIVSGTPQKKLLIETLCNLDINKNKQLPGVHVRSPNKPTVMVVGHIVGKFLYGGERSLLDILDGFVSIDYNTIVTVPKDNNEQYIRALQERSCKVIIFPYTWSPQGKTVNEKSIDLFTDIMARENIDVVHVNTIMLREPLLAARRQKIPSVVHIRELIKQDKIVCEKIGMSPEEVISNIQESTDYIIANSKAVATCFEKPTHTYLVSNCIDIDRFNIFNEFDMQKINIALVSSNIPKKGLWDFIEIAIILYKEIPGATFHLVGPINEHTQEIKRKQAAGEVPPNVNLAGYYNDPLSAISIANIIVNLSNVGESFGRTILEAMAARRPVVVYKYGALPELVIDGETGFVVPYRDVKAAAECIKKLCYNKQLLISMGCAGRRLAEKYYSKACYSKYLKDAYDNILPLQKAKKNSKGNKHTRNVHSTPSATHCKVKDLKIKLLDLGFYEQAYSDLQDLRKDTSQISIRKRAAWELALWHANKYSKNDAVACLELLSLATQNESDSLRLSHACVLETECRDTLDDQKTGRKIIQKALKSYPCADLYLAAANLEHSASKKLDFINKVFDNYNLSRISFDLNNSSPLFNRLAPGKEESLKCSHLPENVPKVTIIIPAFNSEETITTAIESLVAQTWPNLEILVVDDCSTDGTVAAVQKHSRKDSRIQLIKAKLNQGPYVARNLALKQASGDFVTCHDADDWSHPKKIEIQAKRLMENQEVIANVSRWARVTNDLKFFRRGNPGFYIQLNLSSLMFRRIPLMHELGYWDSVRFGADTEFFDRIKHVFGSRAIEKIPALLSFARSTASSLTENQAFGYPGYPMGARKEYWDSYLYYYKTVNTNSWFKYPFPQKSRFFPVPEVMWPDREEKISGRRYFDVVLVSDFRVWDESNLKLAKEIKNLKQRKIRTGLVQMADYEIVPDLKIDDRIRMLIDGNYIQLLVYGEQITCDQVIIGKLSILQKKQRYVPDIKASNVIVNADLSSIKNNDWPAHMSHEIQCCVKHIQEYFGQVGVWRPIDKNSGIVLAELADSKSMPIILTDKIALINCQGSCKTLDQHKGNEVAVGSATQSLPVYSKDRTRSEINEPECSKKLWLHVGFHKTGTTSIQSYFFKNRKRLLDYDIKYLNIDNEQNHSKSLFSLYCQKPLDYHINKRCGIDSQQKISEHNKLIKQNLINEISENKFSSSIISGEDLSILDSNGVAALRNDIVDYYGDIKIIVYIPEPTSFICSHMSQTIVNTGRKLDDYIFRVLNNPFSIISYKNRLKKFFEIFGPENMVVRPYLNNFLLESDVVIDFLNLIGAHEHLVRHYKKEPSKKNLSFSATAVKVFSFLNEKLPLFSIKSEIYDQLRGDYNKYIMNLLSEINGNKVTLSNKTTKHVYNVLKDDLDWVYKNTGIDLYLFDETDQKSPIDEFNSDGSHCELYASIADMLYELVVSDYLPDHAFQKRFLYLFKKIMPNNDNDLPLGFYKALDDLWLFKSKRLNP